MYVAREDRDGTHYVIERVSGHLAHVERSDGQYAAIGLTAEEADRIASDLNEGERR